MKITYFNQPPSYAKIPDLLAQELNTQALTGEVEIYFPFTSREVDGFINRKNRQELIAHIEQVKENRPYRVCFSPISVLIVPYTKEMPDFLTDYVDLCLGQESVKRFPRANYFRLPAWCLRLFGLFPTIDKIKAKITELEALRKQDPFLRKEFMGGVINKDTRFFSSGSLKVFTMITDIDPYLKHFKINFAGNYKRNDLRLEQIYQGDKVAYLQNFTFNLCPEYLNFHAVVSENLAICLEAGCIPVYWGDLSEDKLYFNEKAMIAYDVTRRMEISEKFREVFLNKDKFLEENIFTPDAAELIFRNIYAPIMAKIELDLDLDLQSYLRDNPQGERIKHFHKQMHPQAWPVFIENSQTYLEKLKKD
ncbi:hypothetical protein [Psittacicella gerlachiana]|uniref:Glycosyl transferase family 10 (Putative fucosyltransferase) n=1 Tax=Psittacicella gerlachiana TaxID=2028574 RepID=A0A3A1YKQ8_9GAMM|nr:hypothetical protein [Psittacicella gerlachiana]RIY37799.1 hypothetical protein CKF59_01505 [Psittacicella gerlachiana]